jgi:hypothetical protein
MSKKKMLYDLFKVGDLIGGENDQFECRIVMTVDIKAQVYGLGFPSDTFKIVYNWRFHSAHETYVLLPPTHIPKEQHDMYRRLNGRY